MKKKILFSLLLVSCFINHIKAQDTSVRIVVGEEVFTATLADNETSQAFTALLPLTINMNEMGGYEKFYYLPESLPGQASNPGTIYEGDLMIWSSNCLVLFYATHPTSYSYIQLGRIDDTTGLREAVGSGNVTVTFELNESPSTIGEIQEKQNPFEVSPFPVRDYLEVSGDFEKLSLYGINGRLVARSTEKVISTNHLPAGLYLLRIESEREETVTLKITIQ